MAASFVFTPTILFIPIQNVTELPGFKLLQSPCNEGTLTSTLRVDTLATPLIGRFAGMVEPS